MNETSQEKKTENVRSKQNVWGQALRRKEKSEDFYFDPAEGSRSVSVLALNGYLDLCSKHVVSSDSIGTP